MRGSNGAVNEKRNRKCLVFSAWFLLVVCIMNQKWLTGTGGLSTGARNLTSARDVTVLADRSRVGKPPVPLGLFLDRAG
jgi:hypothetical protein